MYNQAFVESEVLFVYLIGGFSWYNQIPMLKEIAYYKDRIKRYNPMLNCFITVVEDAKTDEHDRFVEEGVLKEVTIAIKDNFCTKGIRTTAGSKVLDDFIPPYDATVVARLKDAGAIIIGKTNLDAWAHGSSTETSDYGPTKNPWRAKGDKGLERVPGGSSGGSAAAVSAGLVPVAIGSETAGSIRQPASWCGVVGLKPTYGRVSRYGLIAMCSSIDSPGIFGTNIKDVSKVLKVIAGKDPYDATTPDKPVPDYYKLARQNKKYIIGISNEYFEGVEESVKKRVEKAIEVFEKLGHKTKKIELIHPKYAISVYTIIQRSEVSSNLARYTGVHYGGTRVLFGPEAKRRMMLGTYTLLHGYYDQFYKKAQKVRKLIVEDFTRVFKEVDLILSPTTPITALKLGEYKKYPFFGELMDKLLEPSSLAGLPGISIPCGFDEKELPVGVQLIAPWFEEGRILDAAYQFEKETAYFDVIERGLKRYK